MTVYTHQKLFLSFLITALVSLNACKNQSNNWTNTLKEIAASKDINTGNLNFEFTLPAHWFRLDTTISGLKICYLIKDSDDFNPLLNVLTESMHGQTHSNYFSGTKTYLIARKTTHQVLNQGQFFAAGKRCLWYSYDRTQNGVTREMIYYSIAESGISYNITAGVNPGGKRNV